MQNFILGNLHVFKYYTFGKTITYTAKAYLHNQIQVRICHFW